MGMDMPPTLAPTLLPAPVSVAATAPVGVLYIVYEQRKTSNAKASRLPLYLAEAARSAASVREKNPSLPVALTTTESASLPKSIMYPYCGSNTTAIIRILKLPCFISRVNRSAFERVLQLAAAKPREPLWAPRLRALAASPFDLTLALDSHATTCSSHLHDALLLEARRSGAHYDLAV